jgi:hypothetical protein
MKLRDGTEVEYYCLNNWVARWGADGILSGNTYPRFDEVPDARVIPENIALLDRDDNVPRQTRVRYVPPVTSSRESPPGEASRRRIPAAQAA